MGETVLFWAESRVERSVRGRKAPVFVKKLRNIPETSCLTRQDMFTQEWSERLTLVQRAPDAKPKKADDTLRDRPLSSVRYGLIGSELIRLT